MKRALSFIPLLMLVWVINLPYTAQALSFFTTPDSTFYQRYPYIRIVEGKEQISISDEEFLQQAGKVIFPVNKYDLPKNDVLLTELVKEVIPQIHKDSLQLLRVMLRGAASPEGPFYNNKMLSKRRAEVLLRFICNQLNMAEEELLTTQTEVEDYRYLCIMMRWADDPDYKLVQRLCDKHLPRREYTLLGYQLQQIKGGRLWQRLLKEYFPQLRAARIMLFLKKKQIPAPKPQVITATTAPADMEKTHSMAVKATPADTIVQTVALPRRELLAVKTNLLFYGIYMPGYNRWCPIPNIAIEYFPKHGHFTFGASFDCPWWVHYKHHKFFQLRNYQVEARYYLKESWDYRSNTVTENPGAAFKGFYLQAYAHAGLFEIGFDADRGWKGEGWGAGIGVGYMLPLSRNGHWRLEFAAQFGWFGCKYDPFQYENLVNPDYHDGLYYYGWAGKASLFKKRQYRYNWFGPTRIGISISYDLLYRKKQVRTTSPAVQGERRTAL